MSYQINCNRNNPESIQVKNQVALPVILLILAVLFSISPAFASDWPMPKLNKDGDYVTRGYPYWEVVDPDPAGLNGRLSMDHPYEWFSPGCQYKKRNISEWPVIRRFHTGTILIADTCPAGFCISTDDRGKPWIRVSIDTDNGGIICYVRANKKYVKPVAKRSDFKKTLTFRLAEWKEYTDDGDIYIKPDKKSKKLGYKSRYGDTFVIMSEKGDWYRVFTRGNKYGYILKKDLKVGKNIIIGAARTVKKTGMRKYPIDSYPVFRTLEPGQVIFLASAQKGEVDFIGLYKQIDDTAPWIRVLADNLFYGFVNPVNLEWIVLE